MKQPSLLDTPSEGSNLPEFGVGELSMLLKRKLEEDFGHVRVKGEITQPKLHSSGHLYLTLKDENAVLSAVCWRGTVSKLNIRPEEGMEVVATGRITTYPGRSQYQLVIEQMALAGVGALLKMLDERRKKLAAEGLFDAARKKQLPFLPRTIGVITSPTGAVIRDILHRLEDRFPCRVLLWPVAVQGEGAAAQIAGAITCFNSLLRDYSAPDGATVTAHNIPAPDVIIVARGGGSLEDMLPFYEEVVVRAAANSRIPLISAVGHETDTTMIDFAADKRAPTPTAAAEMAVPVRLDLLSTLAAHGERLSGALRTRLQKNKLELEKTAARLVHPRTLLENLTQRLDDRTERLAMAMQSILQRGADALNRRAAGLSLMPLKQGMAHNAQKLENFYERLRAATLRRMEKAEEKTTSLSALLESYSYQGVLKRGFALVRGDDGRTIMRAADIKAGEDIALTFADGTRSAKAK